MQVVEIGCGVTAGPFFEGADTHYIVDTDEHALESAAARNPALTPLANSDARSLGLAEASIDVVLARNVFGDPGLGMSTEERGMQFGYSIALLRDEGIEASLAFTEDVRRIIHSVKYSIMREAARVLVNGGRLIAVEQYTPDDADRFFMEYQNGDPDCREFAIVAGEVEELTPAGYVDGLNVLPGDRAWVGIKL